MEISCNESNHHDQVIGDVSFQISLLLLEEVHINNFAYKVCLYIFVMFTPIEAAGKLKQNDPLFLVHSSR